MSAQSSSSRRSRRPNRRSGRTPTSTVTLSNSRNEIRLPNPRPYLSEFVHCFKRKCADLTLIAAGGFPTSNLPVGSSASSFLAFGSPSADTGYTVDSPTFWPFALQLSLTNLPNYTDFTNLFREYQVHAVEIVFQLMSSEAALNVRPELWIYSDPSDATPPANATTMEQFADCSRYTLSSQYSVRRNVIPRPAAYFYGPGSEYGYQADSHRNLWCNSVTSPDMIFYGLKGAFRSYPTAPGIYIQVRASATVWLGARRPY